MAFCGKCGQKIEEGIKFCPACGAPVEVNAQQTAQQQTQQQSNTFGNLNNAADTTVQFNKTDIEQNKVMAILAYFGILVLIPIFAAKESKFARCHLGYFVETLFRHQPSGACRCCLCCACRYRNYQCGEWESKRTTRDR